MKANGFELKIVAAALIRNGTKILISKRFPDSHLGGYWEFPGGKLELDESPEACLVRELKEEMDIEIRVSRIAQVVFHRYPTFNLLMLAYHAEWVGGELNAIGCADWKWVEPRLIKHLPFPPADKPILEELINEDTDGQAAGGNHEAAPDAGADRIAEGG